MKHFSHQAYMERAVSLALQNMESGLGGPFGAVIVYKNAIIAEGANNVTKSMDPTAHAEVVAIREACKKLNNFSLKGCAIYASCEPCPMCLSAIYWSRIDALYFAASRNDAANAGFDDEFLYKELNLFPEERSLQTTQLNYPEAGEVLRKWQQHPGKIAY